MRRARRDRKVGKHISISATEGYAADWTIAQLREPAQRIADRIEALMMTRPEPASPAA